MPHPTDDSDANMLPDPELNPLLNPLLAAHMGRWAEVYFTNPPEKRSHAISELLRELGNSSTSQSASLPLTGDQQTKNITETPEVPDSGPTASELVLACSVCEYQNSAGHEFCGMCGAPLPASREVHAPPATEASPIDGGSWSKDEASAGGSSVESAVSSTAASDANDGVEPILPPRKKTFPNFDLESEPVPRRQRLYMRAALAILLAVLGYVVWRGTGTFSSSPPPEGTLEAPPQSATVNSAQQPGAKRKDQAKDQAEDRRPAPPEVVPGDAGSSPMAVDQGGAAELAMAEKYLNGNEGMPRDSAEAAQWLWKAVRKRNITATMALSDLYLRGEGVPKNCDQARLLLDAAARQGATAATERLSSLQAFGCE